jgi:ABC-type Fe3+ transport system permease subunit
VSTASSGKTMPYRTRGAGGHVERSGIWASLPAYLIIGICSGLPLLWMAGAIVLSSPAVRAELRITSFRVELLARTLGYNGAAAIIATVMGLPAAFVLGRGRGPIARVLWVVLPAALLMPSLSYAYGWHELAWLYRDDLRSIGITMTPGGTADTLRCIWSLGAWLWAVPAGLIGLALRRMDTAVQQQAVMDGALRRITLRQLLPSIIASLAVVTVLSTQEFAVYEPTGISVIATEVRMVFDTGALSSPDNLIAGPSLQGLGAASPDQPARAAAAVATAIPLLIATILLAAIVAWAASRASAAETVTVGSWPRVLDAPRWTIILTLLLLVLNVGVPIAALCRALQEPFLPGKLWAVFGPQVGGAVLVGSMAAALAAVAAFSAASRRTPMLLILSGATFLIGGQILAIADIRIYNRPGLIWAYNAFPVPVIAYVGRFGWLAMAASRGTWTRPWRELRDVAAVDGASRWQSALHVVWPLAWPMLLAGGLLVGALSMTEVPATVLLFPQNPQVLTPTLMTWVHMVRYDPMIEASLVMMAAVLVPAIAALLLTSLGLRILRTPIASGARAG